MITVETATELARLLKRFLAAQARSTVAQDARSRLPGGSTRARVTTANANWANAAEQRDRDKDAVESMLCELVRPPVVAAIRHAEASMASDIAVAHNALLDALGHLRQLGGL